MSLVHDAIFNLYGGVAGTRFEVHGRGTINVYGSELDITGGILTGSLADGTRLNHAIITVDDGRVVLHNIPEPSALAIWSVLGLTGVGFANWRQR